MWSTITISILLMSMPATVAHSPESMQSPETLSASGSESSVESGLFCIEAPQPPPTRITVDSPALGGAYCNCRLPGGAWGQFQNGVCMQLICIIPDVEPQD